MEKRPRIFFVVNADWFFLSHYLPFARAARDAGAQVTAVTGDTGRSEDIRREGLDFVPLPISRKSLNPLVEARTFMFLVRLYRKLRPDLVHHVTIKPVIYGSIAARTLRRSAIVNTISGRGYLYSDSQRARLYRPLVNFLFRVALGHPRSRTVFQNPEDRDELVRNRLVKLERTRLIPGSGVNCSRFQPTPEPDGVPIAMLPSRMLWDKGVIEFLEAAQLAREEGTQARFVLVGDTDPGNPAAIPKEQLESWARGGSVEWWGYSNDMPHTLSQANLVVLPTYYREGLPKVLLEASACARALVATDIPGCREVVKPQENGLLVPPHDSEGLARAIKTLVESPELRGRLGHAAREMVVEQFAEDIVVERMLKIYRELLGAKGLEKPLVGAV